MPRRHEFYTDHSEKKKSGEKGEGRVVRCMLSKSPTHTTPWQQPGIHLDCVTHERTEYDSSASRTSRGDVQRLNIKSIHVQQIGGKDVVDYQT